MAKSKKKSAETKLNCYPESLLTERTSTKDGKENIFYYTYDKGEEVCLTVINSFSEANFPWIYNWMLNHGAMWCDIGKCFSFYIPKGYVDYVLRMFTAEGWVTYEMYHQYIFYGSIDKKCEIGALALKVMLANHGVNINDVPELFDKYKYRKAYEYLQEHGINVFIEESKEEEESEEYYTPRLVINFAEANILFSKVIDPSFG